MLQYRLYGGNDLPAGLQGLLKAAANIGSVIGQFLFGQLKDQLHRALFSFFYLGYLADSLGRKAICTCLCIALDLCLFSERLDRRERAHANHIRDNYVSDDTDWCAFPLVIAKNCSSKFSQAL